MKNLHETELRSAWELSLSTRCYKVTRKIFACRRWQSVSEFTCRRHFKRRWLSARSWVKSNEK